MCRSFDEIELPNLTVTEANPAAWLDFYRFSSQQVSAYLAMQAAILRAKSPGRFLTTNLMGFFYQFDAFALANSTLDFVAWDNYPLGFTDTSLGLGQVFTPLQQTKYFHTVRTRMGNRISVCLSPFASHPSVNHSLRGPGSALNELFADDVHLLVLIPSTVASCARVILI